MKPYVVRSLALFVTLFFFACEGEVGPTGPAGAAGADGADGATGPAGPPSIQNYTASLDEA